MPSPLKLPLTLVSGSVHALRHPVRTLTGVAALGRTVVGAVVTRDAPTRTPAGPAAPSAAPSPAPSPAPSAAPSPAASPRKDQGDPLGDALRRDTEPAAEAESSTEGAPAKKAPTRRAPTKKAPAKKAPGTSASAPKKAPATKAAATKAAPATKPTAVPESPVEVPGDVDLAELGRQQVLEAGGEDVSPAAGEPVVTEPSAVTGPGDADEVPSPSAQPADEDVSVTTPVGTTGAGAGTNPDTTETGLQQPGTEPVMDPATTKRIKGESGTLRKASEPRKG